MIAILVGANCMYLLYPIVMQVRSSTICDLVRAKSKAYHRQGVDLRMHIFGAHGQNATIVLNKLLKLTL
jgi:creatinine amidohydrolase/Fe(II)-dependent formamide hydrolase-like protein